MLKFKAVAVLLAVIMVFGILTACGGSSSTSGSQPATTQQGSQPATTQTQPATTEAQPATTKAEPATTQAATTQTAPAATKAQPATTQAPASEYKDGVYKVQINKYDSHGYAGLLELTIKDGNISAINFNEINKDGKLKSTDEAYRKAMEPVTKTYPEKVYSTLTQQFMAKKSASIDGVASATQTSTLFKGMVKYALEMAKKGDTTPAQIPAP